MSVAATTAASANPEILLKACTRSSSQTFVGNRCKPLYQMEGCGEQALCFSVWIRHRRLISLLLSGPQRVNQQQDSPNHDGRIRHIKVGPVVTDNVDLKEIDHSPVGDAVPGVPDGPTQNQR